MGESWDVLEDKCEPTVTPPQPVVTVTPPQPTVTDSTANTTAFSTSQPVLLNTTVQQNVSVQESSLDAPNLPSHSPLLFLLIFVVSMAVIVLIAVFVVNKAVRRLRRGTRQLDRLWWEDVVARKELMLG